MGEAGRLAAQVAARPGKARAAGRQRANERERSTPSARRARASPGNRGGESRGAFRTLSSKVSGLRTTTMEWAECRARPRGELRRLLVRSHVAGERGSRTSSRVSSRAWTARSSSRCSEWHGMEARGTGWQRVGGSDQGVATTRHRGARAATGASGKLRHRVQPPTASRGRVSPGRDALAPHPRPDLHRTMRLHPTGTAPRARSSSPPWRSAWVPAVLAYTALVAVDGWLAPAAGEPLVLRWARAAAEGFIWTFFGLYLLFTGLAGSRAGSHIVNRQ